MYEIGPRRAGIADEEIVGKNLGVQALLTCSVLGMLTTLIVLRNNTEFIRQWGLIFGFVSTLITVHLCIDRHFYHYGVSHRGLTEYLFGRKIRTVSWDKVTQIAVSGDNSNVRAVVVSLYGSMKYPDKNNLYAASYCRRWRPRAIYIADASKSLPILEKYYPGKIAHPTRADLI